MDAVFAKTERGLSEISTKAGGLTPPMRWVLLLVDGKRTVSDLRALRPSDDMRRTLGMLEEDGYITLVDDEYTAPAPAAKKAASPAPVSAPASIFTPVPDPIDATRLLHSRNFMANTLKTFIGMVGISSLLDRIEEAKTHTELRGIFDEWYHTIANSREGRREAETLRARLLQII